MAQERGSTLQASSSGNRYADTTILPLPRHLRHLIHAPAPHPSRHPQPQPHHPSQRRLQTLNLSLTVPLVLLREQQHLHPHRPVARCCPFFEHAPQYWSHRSPVGLAPPSPSPPPPPPPLLPRFLARKRLLGSFLLQTHPLVTPPPLQTTVDRNPRSPAAPRCLPGLLEAASGPHASRELRSSDGSAPRRSILPGTDDVTERTIRRQRARKQRGGGVSRGGVTTDRETLPRAFATAKFVSDTTRDRKGTLIDLQVLQDTGKPPVESQRCSPTRSPHTSETGGETFAHCARQEGECIEAESQRRGTINQNNPTRRHFVTPSHNSRSSDSDDVKDTHKER